MSNKAKESIPRFEGLSYLQPLVLLLAVMIVKILIKMPFDA